MNMDEIKQIISDAFERERRARKMMPICQHKHCRKTATIKVGEVYNYEDSGIKDVYDPIYMCSKHALKFIEKYGGKNESKD